MLARSWGEDVKNDQGQVILKINFFQLIDKSEPSYKTEKNSEKKYEYNNLGLIVKEISKKSTRIYEYK
jgi:hypothetical protein